MTLSTGGFKAVRRLWGEGAAALDGRTLTVRLEDRDAAVLLLE